MDTQFGKASGKAHGPIAYWGLALLATGGCWWLAISEPAFIGAIFIAGVCLGAFVAYRFLSTHVVYLEDQVKKHMSRVDEVVQEKTLLQDQLMDRRRSSLEKPEHGVETEQ